MGFEVELKFRVDHFARVTTALTELGGVVPGPEQAVSQTDLYWNHPQRDFVRTREAFRFRREGARQCFTYKGPRQPGVAKTREEIEVDFADGPDAWASMVTLYVRLGFSPVAEITKSRRYVTVQWRDHPMVVALDETPDLGCFVEVEAFSHNGTPGSSEATEELARLQNLVITLANHLGLREDESEPRSYLRMHLERLGIDQGKDTTGVPAPGP